MRDLSSEELVHVYGAGHRQSPCAPKHRPKKHRNPCKGNGGSGSGSGGGRGRRCGKGGSS